MRRPLAFAGKIEARQRPSASVVATPLPGEKNDPPRVRLLLGEIRDDPGPDDRTTCLVSDDAADRCTGLQFQGCRQGDHRVEFGPIPVEARRDEAVSEGSDLERYRRSPAGMGTRQRPSASVNRSESECGRSKSRSSTAAPATGFLSDLADTVRVSERAGWGPESTRGFVLALGSAGAAPGVCPAPRRASPSRRVPQRPR